MCMLTHRVPFLYIEQKSCKKRMGYYQALTLFAVTWYTKQQCNAGLHHMFDLAKKMSCSKRKHHKSRKERFTT